MNRTLLDLTARQLLGRRRVVLIAVLALLPVAIAGVYRLGGAADRTAPIQFAPDLMQAFVVPVVLPLCALVFGTAALGAESEDGTIVYLLAKPIERWRIVAAKLVVAIAATAMLAVPVSAATVLIAFGGFDDTGLVAGFVVAVAVGAAVYCSLFVALSAITSRALLIGMGYVFVWEATITGFFSGTRILAVRHYVLGIADAISSAPAVFFDAPLGGVEAVAASAVAIVLAFLLSVFALQRFEIGEGA